MSLEIPPADNRFGGQGPDHETRDGRDRGHDQSAVLIGTVAEEPFRDGRTYRQPYGRTKRDSEFRRTRAKSDIRQRRDREARQRSDDAHPEHHQQHERAARIGMHQPAVGNNGIEDAGPNQKDKLLDQGVVGYRAGGPDASSCPEKQERRSSEDQRAYDVAKSGSSNDGTVSAAYCHEHGEPAQYSGDRRPEQLLETRRRTWLAAHTVQVASVPHRTVKYSL